MINLVVYTSKLIMSPLPLNSNITYLVSSFAHQFARLLTLSFQKQGIAVTAEQFAILVLLSQQDGLPQQEISKRLERDKTTITRVLINLKKLGLIRQQGDDADSRAKYVYLTAQGKRLQARALQVAGDLYTHVLSGINEKEIRQGVKLLRQMNEAIKAAYYYL
ncbi:MAG TPA: MarR family transcriptional regulator [Chitinophagaceae bacterium]|nr:MarR family transcriptional regulator [Chitinophagaceae bacterium]